MCSLNKIMLLENNSNNTKLIRKTYGLDDGSVENAIASLDQWVKSQTQFGKKHFAKNYLEATLIASKGESEKAKAKIEKLFSLRTEMPEYFKDFDIRKDFAELDGVLHYAVLPKLTKEHARVLIMRNTGKSFQTNVVQQFVRIIIMLFEYLKLHDHFDGFVLIFDMTEASLMQIVRRMRLEEVRRAAIIIIGIYGMRFKGIHAISSSRLLNVLVWILKQVMPAKLLDRIHAHQSIKPVYSFVDRELLPQDYGGKESSLEIIHERWQQALGSDQFRAFQREMSKAIISEVSGPSSADSIETGSESDGYKNSED